MNAYKIYFGAILVFISIVASAQQKSMLQHFRELSRPEKWWVITHPFSASRALEISQHVREVSRAMEHHPQLDGQGSGGQVDAFKHAYWMALMAKEVHPRRAWRLGYDHEKGNKLHFKKNRGDSTGRLPTALDCTMDIFNNEMGIEIGKNHPDATREELQRIILEKLLDGYFIVIKKDKQGNLLDCEGNLINKELYFHRWEVPACLVPSSYNPRQNQDHSKANTYYTP